jgi:hypothetical protein
VNSREAVVLVRYVRALCPSQKIDEFTPDAWFDLLAGYDLDDCRAACAQLAVRQPFIAPSEIIDEVRKARRDRLENFTYDPPPAERDPKYLDRLRGQLRAVASGAVPAPTEAPMLTGGPHDDVADRLAGIGRAIPEDGPGRRPGSRGVECPTCSALIGRDCKTPGGSRRAPHVARSAAAGVPGVDAPLDPEQARREAERRQRASRTLLDMGDEAS